MFSCDLTSSRPANKLQNNYISDVLNNNYMNKCKSDSKRELNNQYQFGKQYLTLIHTHDHTRNHYT